MSAGTQATGPSSTVSQESRELDRNWSRWDMKHVWEASFGGGSFIHHDTVLALAIIFKIFFVLSPSLVKQLMLTAITVFLPRFFCTFISLVP